jgi:NAD(P)-dependent dehydrogenase (short-subunit alcohol dehydrogenase family)
MKVLITGASGGLGGVMACAFMGAGHEIAGVARTWRPEQSAAGFHPITADLGNPEGARHAVQLAGERLGAVDAVVHTVGGFYGGPNVAETGLAAAHQMMDLNYWSAFHLAQAILPVFAAQGQGRFVAIGALAAGTQPPGLSAYSASKAALRSLIRSIAHENKGTGLTANLISPGTMDTAANRAAMPQADPAHWIPPKHVASLALWLCGPEAASVTGQDFAVTGRD